MTTGRPPWDGLHPQRPPDELRARVLAAAREAALPEARIVVRLVHDPLLRWCAATLAALVLANALVTWEVRFQSVPPKVADAGDGLAVPVDGGLTASQQMRALPLES